MTQANVPNHVAIIMDGNGRWAKSRSLPRIRGHQIGVERVEEIIRVAPNYGVKYLTLYAFSKENWQRPEKEVSFLMEMLSQYLDRKVAELKKNNMVFNTIGDISDLPAGVQQKIAKGKEETSSNTGLTVTFAFSYSSRDEITKACQKLAADAASGKLDPASINEDSITNALYTEGLPDPDLLVRTSGEMRLSNFLLWQCSYTELYITDTLWPDFTEEEFQKAVLDFSKRERRYGLTAPPKQNVAGGES